MRARPKRATEAEGDGVAVPGIRYRTGHFEDVLDKTELRDQRLQAAIQRDPKAETYMIVVHDRPPVAEFVWLPAEGRALIVRGDNFVSLPETSRQFRTAREAFLYWLERYSARSDARIDARCDAPKAADMRDTPKAAAGKSERAASPTAPLPVEPPAKPGPTARRGTSVRLPADPITGLRDAGAEALKTFLASDQEELPEKIEFPVAPKTKATARKIG